MGSLKLLGRIIALIALTLSGNPALSQDVEQRFNLEELKVNITSFGLVDLSVISKTKFEDQISAVATIEKRFENTLIFRRSGLVDIVVLPRGFDHVEPDGENLSVFQPLIQRASLSDQADQTNLSLEEVPPYVELLKLASAQADHQLIYNRVVGPKQPSQAYSFTLEYIASEDSMLPVQKNGRPGTAREMEGYSNFHGVASYIKRHEAEFVVARRDEDWFLKLKEQPESSIMLSMNSGQLDVVMQNNSNASNFQQFVIALSGSAEQMLIRTELLSGGQSIVLLDSVERTKP